MYNLQIYFGKQVLPNCLYVKHINPTSLARTWSAPCVSVAIASQKTPLRHTVKNHFEIMSHCTHSSKHSKQDENTIRNQCLTLLRFKCGAPPLILCTHFVLTATMDEMRFTMTRLIKAY